MSFAWLRFSFAALTDFMFVSAFACMSLWAGKARKTSRSISICYRCLWSQSDIYSLPHIKDMHSVTLWAIDQSINQSFAVKTFHKSNAYTNEHEYTDKANKKTRSMCRLIKLKLIESVEFLNELRLQRSPPILALARACKNFPAASSVWKSSYEQECGKSMPRSH